jgi:hypothetical protein
MQAFLITYNGELSLVTDGWPNSNNKSVIKYAVVTRIKAVFIKAVHTGKDRHTGMYIAESLIEVIKKLCPENLCAVTTDNPAIYGHLGSMYELSIHYLRRGL